jgi:glycosyltransferase involved in cell wall biosynthesis
MKLVYVISGINKALAFEWMHSHLKDDFNLVFIFLAPQHPESVKEIEKQGGLVHFLKLTGKKDYPFIYIKLGLLLNRIKPDIVHTHLRDADLLGLSLAKFLGIKKRITTRHSSVYNRIYHPKSVIIDKQFNRWATDIVAISENVKQVLIEEGAPHKKITLIHHGFDLNKFKEVDSKKIEDLRTKYQTEEYYPIIGVISRYIAWKGQQYIVEAFKKLLKNYPNAKLVLANASGPYKGSIQKQLKDLPKNSYIEIPFESDIFALYQLFDIFVHAPIDLRIEAFGQIYIEALAAGIPSVFTLSGVAPEFIKDKKNAIVVDFKNSEQILASIKLILEKPDLREKIIEKGKKSVERFKLDLFTEKLKILYKN